MPDAVAPLLHHPALARARAHLERTDARTLDIQATLSAIPAPTGGERYRAARVAELMGTVGLTAVRTDDVGNVTGWRGTPDDAGAVVLAAHLDTVFGPEVDVLVRRSGHRLDGPGVTDNARGLAVLLALADAMISAEWVTSRPVAFVATVGEEGAGNLRGARHLFGNGHPAAHAAIILDGAGDDRVVHAALGSRRSRENYRGPGGHSWSAFGVANPATAAGTLAQGVATLRRPDTPRTTCAVTGLGGGTSLNSIPEQAWVEIDLRSEGMDAIEATERALRALADGAAEEENARRASGPPVVFDWQLLGDRPSGATPMRHDLVQAALAATRAIGRRPTLATASTDANIPISLGIPAIALGGGGKGGEPHRLTEWYENSDGALGIYRVLLILGVVAGLR